MRECKYIYSFSLESQPDCIKLFPFHDSPETRLNGSFIVSCYKYDENTRERDGCLLFFNPCSFLASKLNSLNLHEQIPKINYFGTDLGGILSCSWTRFENAYGVSSISSDSTISQFILDSSHDDSCQTECKFMLLNKLKLCEDPGSSVALSLSLSDEYGRSMCVTCSDGTAYLVRGADIVFKWKPHDLETWTSAFHPQDSNLVLTGSDDSTVKLFDLRSGCELVSTIACHKSGVTAVQFLPSSSHLFYTGGFDNLLVTHDYRNMSKPLESLETNTPVWFIDFVTDSSGILNQLHISGCHDGSAIYDASGSLVSFFNPDRPLIYGTSHTSLGSTTVYCCCDFYNKSLHFYV